jgi:hypothetical protein
MSSSDLEARLLLLNYSMDWINSGVLTESILDDQIQELSKGDDINTEHYRYKTFILYLSTHNPLTHTQLNQLLDILQKDTDVSMAVSVSILLLKLQYLTDSEFDLVSKTLITFGDWTKKYINNHKNLRNNNNESIH